MITYYLGEEMVEIFDKGICQHFKEGNHLAEEIDRYVRLQ